MVLEGLTRVLEGFYKVLEGLLTGLKGLRRALGFQIKLGNPETGRRCKKNSSQARLENKSV